MGRFPHFFAQDSPLVDQSHSSVQEECVGRAGVKNGGEKGHNIFHRHVPAGALVRCCTVHGHLQAIE